MDKTDRRIIRTQRLLQQALIELVLDHGYDAITIREITEQADVGYATFFRHYSDKDELLAAVLQSMKEDFEQLLSPHWVVSEPEKGSAVLFTYVQENFELARVLLDSTSTMSLLRPIQDVGHKEIIENIGASYQTLVPLEIAANHIISSLIMMIRWWVENDMPYTPQQMGEFAARLVIDPVIAVMAKS